MKHPVDTSTWGEFKVGELFDVHPTKAYKLKNSDLLSVDGEIPVVVNSSYNNGIGGYSKLEPTEQPGILTFSDTTSGSNTLFYQNQAFIGYAHVQGMYPKNFELTDLTALFMIATLRATIDQRKWDYTNKLNRTTVIEMHVKLPLKQGTNPADYSQNDIDWHYMESFMSRVQDAAKKRLANLPEPGQKSKTPVDTSTWGEFKVGELFDKLELKRIKPTFNKHSDLSPIKTDEFDLPLINAKVGNNGIMYYGRSCDWQSDIMTIDIVNDGAASAGMVYAQPQQTGTLYNAYQIKLKQTVNYEPTVSQLLFLTTVIQASIQTKFSYDNKAIWQKVKEETIPLPLKPHQGDYSQEDIDWDYMESFMSQFQTLAKNRLERLTSAHDCDILTI